MRSDRESLRSERQLETDAVRRLGRDHERHTDEALASGRFAEPRSWLDRTRDEIASWFGATGAMRRRQWDEASGDHAGQGPTQTIDADARIVEMLNHRLTIDHELDASDIEVACEEGVVTLDGAARTSAAVQRAEGLATGVSGVKRVVNNLIVA
jgi:osmotically-inducible protein OsmY